MQGCAVRSTGVHLATRPPTWRPAGPPRLRTPSRATAAAAHPAVAQSPAPPTGPPPTDPRERAAAAQLTSVAAALSGQRCHELLAAINVELLKSALVSQAHPEAGARGGAALAGSESCAACTAEGLLVETLEAARRVQEQACGSVAAEQADNWEHVMWEAFACTRKGVGCTLFDLQVLAANLGSAEGALQVAHCLATGMLVPRDEAAALDWCHRAAEMGSPDAALKCGVHHYEGRAGTASSTVFAGRVGSSERGEADEQGALAYDFFSRALELCERAMTEEEQASSGHARATAGEGAEASSEEGGAAFVPSAGLEVVRRSALSWLGRCHLEGRGVPHDVARAAELFRRAENKEELRELAMLKRQFEAVELVGLEEAEE